MADSGLLDEGKSERLCLFRVFNPVRGDRHYADGVQGRRITYLLQQIEIPRAEPGALRDGDRHVFEVVRHDDRVREQKFIESLRPLQVRRKYDVREEVAAAYGDHEFARQGERFQRFDCVPVWHIEVVSAQQVGDVS